MTIYRCDKCKKEVKYITEIYRIKVLSETCDFDDDTPKWYPSRKTVYYDVCAECCKNILQSFVDQFKEEELRNGKTEPYTGHGD